MLLDKGTMHQLYLLCSLQLCQIRHMHHINEPCMYVQGAFSFHPLVTIPRLRTAGWSALLEWYHQHGYCTRMWWYIQ